MGEKYFEKIPPSEVTPLVEKIPPQEITSSPEIETDLASAETIPEKEEKETDAEKIEQPPETALDFMARAESGTESEKSKEKTEIMEKSFKERLEILNGVFVRVKNSIETSGTELKDVGSEITGEIRGATFDHLPRSAQRLLSRIGDASGFALLGQAYKNKNLIGEKFSRKERIMTALLGGTTLLSEALILFSVLAKNPENARAIARSLYGASWILLIAKNGRSAMEDLQELASECHLDEAKLVLARAGENFGRYGYENFDQELYTDA
jgi:hypothetical protein